VPEDVLAVFRAHPHEGFAVTRGEWAVGQIPHVGKEVGPLRRQQIHQVQAFRLTFEDRRGRRDEVHMSVGGDPALGAEIGVAVDFQFQCALAGLDFKPLANSLVFEPLGDFHKHLAHRKLHLKGAIDVGEGSVH
jgi:hypothetical protein